MSDSLDINITEEVIDGSVIDEIKVSITDETIDASVTEDLVYCPQVIETFKVTEDNIIVNIQNDVIEKSISDTIAVNFKETLLVYSDAVPKSGTTGQMLVKVSNADRDTKWKTPQKTVVSITPPINPNTNDIWIDIS